MEDQKCDDNAEEDKEEVDFFLHVLLGSKSLNSHILQVPTDSNIEDEHREEGHDGGKWNVEVSNVHLDVTLR